MDNKLGVCEYCSSEFVKKYKSQRFCCRECSTKSRIWKYMIDEKNI